MMKGRLHCHLSDVTPGGNVRADRVVYWHENAMEVKCIIALPQGNWQYSLSGRYGRNGENQWMIPGCLHCMLASFHEELECHWSRAYGGPAREEIPASLFAVFVVGIAHRSVGLYKCQVGLWKLGLTR